MIREIAVRILVQRRYSINVLQGGFLSYPVGVECWREFIFLTGKTGPSANARSRERLRESMNMDISARWRI